MSPTPAPRPPRSRRSTAQRRRVAGSRRPGLRPPARRRRPVMVRVFGWSGWSGLGSLITALAAIGALVFTSGALRATQRENELAEQQQITERFGKAVEQLASDKLDERL